MEEILNKISTIIQDYEIGKYKDLHKAHRELTCSMFYLSKIQIEAHQKYNQLYHNSKETVNAKKERECELLVPELYMCRKILETAKGVSISMSLEIKLN